jgi:16S rRNA (cytosine967-C5)-methyltransferase
VAGDARAAALKALAGRRQKGIRLDEALNDAVKGLPARDIALATRLCYGVTQNYALIDLALKGLVKKTQPQVWDILRLGAYQLWYLDRIPRSALTDEAVRLCKKTAPHAAGMVNAVLRKLPDEPPETDDLAVRYSLPQWFCDRMAALLPPDELEPFFISCNTIPPIYMQPEGIVADPAARRAVDALAPQPGTRIWDTCAAPGGKTVMIAAAMRNEGYLLATDRSAKKLPMITEALARCGVTIVELKQADASSYSPDGQFDAVLCDVPCSGFGVLRKKPDIRFRTEVAHFPALQLSILRNAAKAVRPGGALVYCTCTLLPEENGGVVKELDGFEIESMETLWPHRGDTDGFFICRLKKNGTSPQEG